MIRSIHNIYLQSNKMLILVLLYITVDAVSEQNK
jgi:hypothetical protein